MLRTTTAAILLATLVTAGAGPASGQEAATLTVGQHEQFGHYIADGEGRALYLFTADSKGGEGQDPVIACSNGCLERWPPLHSAGEPQAGEGVDGSLIGRVTHQGAQVVTYGGWPLYYYYNDEWPGDVNGQDIGSFGGEWYLLSPDGETIEIEPEGE